MLTPEQIGRLNELIAERDQADFDHMQAFRTVIGVIGSDPLTPHTHDDMDAAKWRAVEARRRIESIIEGRKGDA